MTLSPSARKLVLTAHVTSSVAWLGAVLTFLALSVAGLVTAEEELARGAYLAMEAIGWLVLVPLALASFVTGVFQSLGTNWGLVRHYWVLFKLVITVIATVVLLLYMQTLALLADIAMKPDAPLSRFQDPSPVLHATVAGILLIVATTLAVFKPAGVTRYGRRGARG